MSSAVRTGRVVLGDLSPDSRFRAIAAYRSARVRGGELDLFPAHLQRKFACEGRAEEFLAEYVTEAERRAFRREQDAIYSYARQVDRLGRFPEQGGYDPRWHRAYTRAGWERPGFDPAQHFVLFAFPRPRQRVHMAYQPLPEAIDPFAGDALFVPLCIPRPAAGERLIAVYFTSRGSQAVQHLLANAAQGFVADAPFAEPLPDEGGFVGSKHHIGIIHTRAALHEEEAKILSWLADKEGFATALVDHWVVPSTAAWCNKPA